MTKLRYPKFYGKRKRGGLGKSYASVICSCGYWDELRRRHYKRCKLRQFLEARGFDWYYSPTRWEFENKRTLDLL